MSTKVTINKKQKPTIDYLKSAYGVENIYDHAGDGYLEVTCKDGEVCTVDPEGKHTWDDL